MKTFLLFLFFLPCILFAKNQDQVTLSGNIVNSSGDAVTSARVEIGNHNVKSNAQGRFELTIPAQDIYQLSIQADDHYRSIHTFSHHELFENRNAKQLSAISLVQKKEKRVMLAFAGDVMMGRRYYQPFFDDPVLITPDNRLEQSKAIVAHIKPYLELADYAAVNLETQIAETKPSERAKKSVTFYSHPSLLEALSWAGVDYVSLGNNHTYDYLESGLDSTLKHLKNSDLDFSGADKNDKQALAAHRESIAGQPFSMLGYVGWTGSSNPSQVATSTHGGAAYGNEINIVDSVSKETRANRIPIVQYHGSQEYANDPTGVTEQRLKMAIDSGAALSIAHHPHVTQGLELYNGQLIAYSMGNFIFDQNFTATKHSFVLYVWLDENKFHHAEIVPVYVKGYKPTPATGMHRYTVMKRLISLSAARGTNIIPSGGHGVISLSNTVNESAEVPLLTFAGNSKQIPLYNTAWHKQINKVELSDAAFKYRLGGNLINNSDFENFDTFDTLERGFYFNKSEARLVAEGASGSKSMLLEVGKKHPQLFGMKHFRRVYKASSPMTVSAQIKVNEAIKVNVYWQGRKTRQKLFDAFENGKMNLIQTIDFTGDEAWQPLEIEFNSPRIGYKSYRVLLEFVNDKNEPVDVFVDDFSLIEWHTAYTQSGASYHQNTLNKQATHIGINKAANISAKLK